MSDTRNPKIHRHLKDLYPELAQAIDAAESAVSVARHPGMSVLRDILLAEITTISRELDNGRPLEQAEYAMAHGRRGGLTAALEALDVLVEWAESRAAAERAKHEGPPVAAGR